MRITITVLLALLLSAPAQADPPPGHSDDPAPAPALDELLLEDGTILRGRLVEEREDLVVFETPSLGRLEIPRDNIVRQAVDDARAGVITDPDYNSVMFCPTPATLARGDSYFRNFELFFLNFGTAVTDEVDLSVGTLFPISSELLMITLGGKVRLLDREDQGLGLALIGSYTNLENLQFGAVGAVAGIGDRRRSLNLMINRTFDDDGDSETAWILGADLQMSRRSKLICEFMSSDQLFADDDPGDEITGFLNFGLRIFGETHSFSLTGFRPLDDSDGGFIAFPMVVYSSHF